MNIWLIWHTISTILHKYSTWISSDSGTYNHFHIHCLCRVHPIHLSCRPLSLSNQEKTSWQTVRKDGKKMEGESSVKACQNTIHDQTTQTGRVLPRPKLYESSSSSSSSSSSYHHHHHHYYYYHNCISSSSSSSPLATKKAVQYTAFAFATACVKRPKATFKTQLDWAASTRFIKVIGACSAIIRSCKSSNDTAKVNSKTKTYGF